MPCLPRSDRMSKMRSTGMETFSIWIPGIVPVALRISVMWGEKRFRSKGILWSASAWRMRRTTACKGADSTGPPQVAETAHTRKRKGKRGKGHGRKSVHYLVFIRVFPDKGQGKVHIFPGRKITADAVVVHLVLYGSECVFHGIR